MNPHTKLMTENKIKVMIGANPDLSAAHPTTALSVPINPTYSMYRSVVVDDLKVNLAFAKKLNDTATTNPAKLPSAWPVWNA